MEDQLKSLFVFEANQNLNLLENILLEIDKSPLIFESKINDIFRIMHTIKGGAGMCGLFSLQTLSHSLENLFHYLRDNAETKVNIIELESLVLKNVDIFRRHLDDPSVVLEENNQEVIDYYNVLTGIVQKKQITNEPNKEKEKEETFSKDEKDLPYLIIFFKPFLQMFSIRAFEISNKLNKARIPHSYTPNELSEIASDEISKNGVKFIFNIDKDIKSAISKLEGDSLISKYTIHNFSTEEDEKIKEQAIYIPITVAKIDNMVNLIGELIVEINEISSTLEDKNVLYRVEKITSSLQETVLSTRMVSFSDTLEKMKRYVRDLSLTLGKKVNFEIIKEELEIDRTINEALFDCLVQLIKNALDHGIEKSEERVLNNKSENGQISITAKRDGKNLNLEISDDGRGFDKEKIIKIALEKNLVTKEHIKQMTDSEIYELTYNSGFSTKTQTTEISGRGVGMDIVQQKVKDLRGYIYIDSTLNKGSTVTIKVPLTLSIIDVFIVKVSDYKIAIPIDEIARVVDPTNDKVVVHEDYFTLYGKDYKYRKLKDFLFEDDLHQSINETIIILNSKKNQAVVVDTVLETKTVVVRPSPPILENIPGLNGIVSIEGGKTIMVLSLHKVMNYFRRGGGNK
ncbi:MAG: Hpt domain-containing protein [Acholeplasmatales bacterium]|jgi:two-component system chemotaxis sensor kinase CheA|nr:Hpt domain-containing protein [Acholeplasmatales bacterium]